jgi:hypothetical protein
LGKGKREELGNGKEVGNVKERQIRKESTNLNNQYYIYYPELTPSALTHPHRNTD